MTHKQILGTIIALGFAGTFFSYLGAAPGYEALFRALMMTVMLVITILAARALITIQSKEKSGQTGESKNRRFHNIELRRVCQ